MLQPSYSSSDTVGALCQPDDIHGKAKLINIHLHVYFGSLGRNLKEILKFILMFTQFSITIVVNSGGIVIL